MGTDVAEAVEKLPSPHDIKVHSIMCTGLMKMVDRIDKIFPEIEAYRPRCSSGIQSLCLLNSAIDKAKSSVRDCSESSKLYLALTGHAVLSRCKKSKKLLEQSLSQIQNMVPVMLASKISQIIAELREMKLSLDPSEEEAGKAVRALLEGYDTGNHSGKESRHECIRIAALKLHITSQKALLMERRSIKKLLNGLGEGDGKQPKKQILMFLLALLTKYGKSIASGDLENNNVVENQDYKSRKVDVCVDYEEARMGGNGVPPEEFKCPISLKLMYDPVVIDSGQTFERMWIQKWFDEGHDVCPKTNRKLSNFSLTPNTAMKDLITRWCETHRVTLSDPCIQLSTDANAWENSCSSVNSLSSMYSFQLPVDFSNLSLSSLDSSHTAEDTRELDVESLSQELDDALPWEFQCKIVEDLMTCLKRDDRACKLISLGNLVESLVKFLKVARAINDVKAQRIGCLLLLLLVGESRNVKYLSEDAYVLIAEFLESEVIEEALAITEVLSSHQNCQSEIASSGALPYIFKILDTQIREIQTPALKILYNLTLTRNVRSLIVSSDLIPKLVTLCEDDSLSRYCIAILTNLCSNQDDKSIIAETNGCVPFIAKVLESESCEEQDQALEILLSLCSQSIQYCRLVMDEGVIPAVVSISINGNDKGRAKAHEMLRLLRDIEHEDYVEESVASDYDISDEPNNFHVEKKTASKTSRFLSKFSLISRSSLAPKRKV
ncbi:U-box domain-containing protein 5-like isoform X1 [Cynara cardunculus var. scolymus]|uniref:U-box domain-containing protein 5-like isoform X1 n=2 Tax=Cynara cardunculus var. scolymus TaxID=59895 RepID=UPI000D62F94B|nr:U-box domain-containing protein 5-like isoform X1 [Cynara cardunculus var. scolymus]